ncbi:MAG: WecB/TagA/CpsF family glycosyltransferase [bacterium]
MELLGVRIDNVTMDEALQKIEGFLSDGRQHYVVTINPEFLVTAQKDKEFKDILNRAGLAIPDGIGVVWASRFFSGGLKERVAGIDLVKSLKLKVKSCRVFLLGGRDGVAEKIAGEWPEVVAFSENPEEGVALINKYEPNILLVALGAPKQEKWIVQNLSKIPSVKVAIGVGGAFDFLAGKISRAPKIFQCLGLEWLWRLAQEPRRIGRIFNAVVVFPVLILMCYNKNRIHKN